MRANFLTAIGFRAAATSTVRAPRSPAASRFLAAVALTLLAATIAPADAFGAGQWSWPVDGEVLTGYRNVSDPYAAGQHRGIDIGAPEGDAVRVAAGGTVTFAGTVGSSGAVVAVRTADGRYDTSYLHLGSIEVGEGDEIGAGDLLGTVGRSGDGSTSAPHLHFGVRDAGEEHAYRDPLRFLGPRGGPATQPPPPAPVVAPVRIGPVPEASRPRAPVPNPLPARAPRPVRAPAPGRVAGPKGAFEPLPAPAAIGAPVGTPAPTGVTAPDATPAPVGEPGRAPAGTLIDLGSALACAGIVLAVALACRPFVRRRRPRGRRAAAKRHEGPGSIERRWATTSPRRSTT